MRPDSNPRPGAPTHNAHGRCSSHRGGAAPAASMHDTYLVGGRVDLLPGGGERVPGGAELIQRLARDLSGLLIGRVVVERVTGVRHASRSVGSLRCTDQAGL